MTYRAFIGDAEYELKLTLPLVLELEAKTGAGISQLARRVFDNQFGTLDIVETIRLSLVGGGTDAKRADTIIKTYVFGQFNQMQAIAADVLEQLLIGSPDQ